MSHDALLTALFALTMVSILVAGVMLVIFGQVTVRKLRKNPATRNCLGLEFMSGWDILNVAGALARPRRWNPVLESGPFSGLYARSEVLLAHTTRFDRRLARVFYCMHWTPAVLMTIWFVVAKLFRGPASQAFPRPHAQTFAGIDLQPIHSALDDLLLGGIVVSGILYIILGQVTVRKLRANPQTRKLMGFEFISGLDILGVSMLMSRPRIPGREYERVASKNPYSPSTDLLHHMSRFDRLLAQAHYRTFMFTMVCLLFWIYWLVFSLLGQRVASP